MYTSLSRFRKFTGLMVVLLAIHLPLSSQAQWSSSLSFCDLATNTGGSCVVIDKNDPNFGALFEAAVLSILVSTIQPTITGVSPQQLPQGSTADILMTSPNAHFNSSSLNGITIGCGIIVNSGTAVFPPNKVVANVTVPSGTALGSCDVKVETNLDGGQKETVTGSKLLLVTAPTATPNILSISPISVYKKSSNVTLTLSGQNTHFDSSSSIDFSDTAITVVSKTVPSATVLKVVVNVGETAKTGFHKVTVTTGGEIAKDVSALGTLQVFEASTTATTPKLTTVQPWQGRQWETVTVSITGQDTNFANGVSKVSLSSSGVEVLSTTVSSATQATATLKVASNAALGFRDVYVTTGAEIATLASAFAVFSPAMISLDKLQGKQGETVTVNITGVGTHFASGQTTLNFDGTGITVSPSFITVNSATSATATLQIASTATTGSRNLSVVTGGEVAVPSTGIVFEIIAVSAPRVDYLSPKEAIQGQTVTSALIGINTHFTTATPTVKFSGTGLTVKSATATSDTNLSLSLELASNAPVGMQGITVTTGSEVATLANAFTVLDTPKVDLSVKVTGSGRVTSSVTGIDCGNSLTACTAKFVKDSSLILTATPTDTSTFVGWAQECSGTSTAVGVTLNASKTCEAKFAAIEYQLTLKKVGSGTISSNFTGSDCGTGCQKILKGTPLTLVAVPDTGSIFKSWSGDCAGTNAQTTLTMAADKTCTATFETVEFYYPLTTSVNGNGTVTFQTTGGKACNPSSDTCQSYPKSSQAKLSASANEGWTFKEWQEDCQGLGNPAKVMMDNEKSCQAVFEELPPDTYTLQVNVTGAGKVQLSVEGDIEECEATENKPCSYKGTTVVNLTAIADEGAEFAGWGGNCEVDTTNPTVAVSLSKDKTCTAAFKEKIIVTEKTLTIDVSGKGQVVSEPTGIDCSDHCQTLFSNNTEVTLTATPTTADSRFVNWQGDCTGSEESVKVTMETDKKCQAVFADGTNYLLQVNVTGTGKVASEPAGIDCSDHCQTQLSNNTEVTLTAIVTDANSPFVKWEGDCQGVENSAQVTMDKDKECQAVFASVEPQLLQLQVNIIGTGNVTSDPAGIACLGNAESGTCSYAYSVGQTVTLIADPANTFIGWEGDCKESSVSTKVIVDANKICTAQFVVTEITTDQDSDGINNDLENAAPNNGDGNDDDTADSTQINVVSIQRSDGLYVTLEVQPATCQFQAVQMIEQKDLPLDAVYNFPYGLVSFELTQCGQAKPEVTEYYHGLIEVPKGAVYRHYNSTTGQWQELPAATFEPDKIAKQSVVTVTLAMTDAKGEGNMTSQGGIAIKLPPSQIQFTQASFAENEYGDVSTTLPSGQQAKGHLVTIGITRQNASQGEVGVGYSIAGTATTGQDFVILSPLDNRLTWVNGDTADKSISVFIIDDTEVEGESPEELKLQLTSPVGNAELGMPSEVVVTIQDDDKVSACTPDATLALSPEQQTVTLKLAEGQKVLTFSGGQGEVKFKTPPDSSIVEATISQSDSISQSGSLDFCELAEAIGGSCVIEPMPLTLTPRQVGETQLVLEDCAGHQATVNIVVEDVVVDKCQDSPIFEPATRNITLGIADQPLTLTFKGGQGRVMPTTMPNEEIISLKLPIYADAETKTTQLELVPRTLGETQLTLGDECNHTAEIKIEVINPECQADDKLTFQPAEQTVTLMETEAQLALFLKGGQGRVKLQEVPKPEIVTLDLPFYTEAGLTQLKLTPRQPGSTHLSLSDCAGHQASVEIKVLKPGTLAALCWLDMNEEGRCQLPDNEKVLNPNVSAINAESKPVEEVDARLEINLQSTPSDNLVLLPTDKLTASVSLASAMLKGQTAELIVALARRGVNGAAGEFLMLKELTTTPPTDPVTATAGETTESDSPSATEPADNEEISEDEATEPSTTSDDSTATTEDTNKDDSPSDTETTPGDDTSLTVDCNDAAMIDYYILTGLCPSPRTKRASVSTAWQSWDGNPANLVAAGQIDTLPAILEQSFELDLSGLSAGEYTLYVGYRLPDGTIIFNGKGKPPSRFWIANSRSFGTETEVETRAYFDLQTQTTDQDEMKVTTTITPDYSHLGQIVDVVMVATYQPVAGGMSSYMRLPNKTWQPWDFQPDMLVPAQKNVTLSDSLTVEVFQGSLGSLAGVMQVFVGYELTDGLIVFGQSPLEIKSP